MPRRSNREHLESLVEAQAARTWPRPERHRVIILFTPRSGSSWFGDLLRSTSLLGTPEEFLNQALNAEGVRRFATRTEIDYLNAIETQTASKSGVFSMEVTWGHVELCEFDLLGYYREARFVYLRRRDILAQAISLLLATETGLFHNRGGDAAKSQAAIAAQLEATDKTFSGIRRWWGHVLNYECLAEVQLAIRGIRPLRLYYEDLVPNPSGTVARVLEFCGVSPSSATQPRSAHKPIRGDANAELARHFTAAETAFIRKMNSFRPPLDGTA